MPVVVALACWSGSRKKVFVVMSARVRYGKRPRRGIRLPSAVEINILSFLLPECKEEVLLAYRRAFGLCLRVSVWLLRRFPRVGRVEAEILAANWPLEVPRGDAAKGSSGEWNFMIGLLGVLGDLNAAALIETETPDFGEYPEEDWDQWVWTELRPDRFRPDDDNEEYCKALAEVLGGVRACVFGVGLVETRWCCVFRSGYRYSAAFAAVLRWCRFLLSECEKILQQPGGPGKEVKEEILNTARLCYRLAWPKTGAQ
jgi:hypothetical protein